MFYRARSDGLRLNGDIRIDVGRDAEELDFEGLHDNRHIPSDRENVQLKLFRGMFQRERFRLEEIRLDRQTGFVKYLALCPSR